MSLHFSKNQILFLTIPTSCMSVVENTFDRMEKLVSGRVINPSFATINLDRTFH